MNAQREGLDARKEAERRDAQKERRFFGTNKREVVNGAMQREESFMSFMMKERGVIHGERETCHCLRLCHTCATLFSTGAEVPGQRVTVQDTSSACIKLGVLPHRKKWARTETGEHGEIFVDINPASLG